MPPWPPLLPPLDPEAFGWMAASRSAFGSTSSSLSARMPLKVLSAEGVERFAGAVHAVDLVPRALQRHRHEVAHHRVVLDDEDAGVRGGGDRRR